MSKSHRRENIKRIENNIKRRRPIRDVSERILIVVEGHSEEKYFNALRKRWRLHTVVVVENPDCTDPINLLGEASELLEESKRQSKNSMLKTPYDEVWIVYDLEKPNDERRRLSNDAKNRARKNSNIHFAISDPSFELWYVLHFEQTTKSFTTAKEIERYLKRHWSNYKKNSEPTNEILDKTNNAITNAKWLRLQLKNNNAESPMTDVDQIVEKLIQYIQLVK